MASDELALAHHVLGMTEQSRLEVLLAASRLSVVQEAPRAATGGSSIPMAVNVTPAALFNAMHQQRVPHQLHHRFELRLHVLLLAGHLHPAPVQRCQLHLGQPVHLRLLRGRFVL